LNLLLLVAEVLVPMVTLETVWAVVVAAGVD
jgi:hypothetical protein